MSFRFLYLTPAEPTRDRLHSCDLCWDTEVEDILSAPPGNPECVGLRPIYQDTRPEEHGLCVCHKCLMDGSLDASEVETREMREAMSK